MPVKDRPLTPVEAGRLGARARWGPERHVRLDRLAPPIAAAIRALISADEAARTKTSDAAKSETKMAAADVQSPATADAEVHGNARPAA